MKKTFLSQLLFSPVYVKKNFLFAYMYSLTLFRNEAFANTIKKITILILNYFGKPVIADFQRAKQKRIVAMANARGVMADQTVVVKQGDGHLFRYTPEVGLDPVRWNGAFTYGKVSLVKLHGTKYLFGTVALVTGYMD